MSVASENIPTLDEPTLTEVTGLYREFISPDLARLLRLTGFGNLEMRTEGCSVYDQQGRRYLDFSGGYGVFSLGHRHPRVVAAVKDQLDRVALSSRVFFNPLMAQLAERLAALTPGDLKVSFFCNSGTEAIEAALKAARLATGRHNFVSAENSYHGKTFGSLSVSGRPTYQQPFEPLIPGCRTVPFGDQRALEQAIDDQVAAFLIEPVQGEGGIHVASPEYLRLARELCDRHGALLIADEVQSGLCRTGRWFAIEHADVAPDIMALAKALGGGVMPIGATIMTPGVARAYQGRPLLHTSTFGGNPLACRAALTALQVMEDEDLATRAADSGRHLLDGLRKLAEEFPDLVAEVRGLGLMVGLEFTEDKFGGSVIFEMVKRQVIAVYTLNQPKVLRFEPPLNVETGEIESALFALKESLAETRRRLGSGQVQDPGKES
jgi:putrescine aminotransferase